MSRRARGSLDGSRSVSSFSRVLGCLAHVQAAMVPVLFGEAYEWLLYEDGVCNFIVVMFLVHLGAPARMTRPPSLRRRLEALPRRRDFRRISSGLARPPSIPGSLAILERSRQFTTCLDDSQSRLAVSCASLMADSIWTAATPRAWMQLV
ncbi:hypothetical protein FN846DRAFT_986284 [Sphaerosporella brunnea]|uniref:Uncharacterized protein n=1 Tax=Sphaerosporella brunnea TaxID=1250544 RepID=A0A5J5ETV4_9PEZI|nr:hypothetical protein FN846DRAFT_986284 [Sphaerosporella brunnea]